MTALTRKENELHNRLIVAEFNLKQVETELRRLRKENKTLRARLENGVALTTAMHPVSMVSPSEYKFSKESLEDGWIEKEWVGLTDDEVADVGLFHAVVDAECVRAIEAKLKEKNA